MKKHLLTFLLLLLSGSLFSIKIFAQEAPGSDGLTPPEAGMQAQLKLTGYPAPAVALIKVEIPSDSKLSLQLYNMSGQLISTLFEGYKTPGSYTINFNSSNLRRGIYICRLIVRSGIKRSVLSSRMIL